MLYKLDSTNKTLEHFSERVSLKDAGLLEKDLENILARDIDILTGENLMVVFQERSWQSEPDILALDEKGKTWIFELKRWSASSDAVHQLLGYAQTFGQLHYDDLNSYFIKYKNIQTSPTIDLAVAHQRYFDLTQPLEKKDFNSEQVLVLVSDGLDLDCYKSVQFWLKNGLNVRYMSAHAYKISNGETALEFSFGQQMGGGYWMINTNGPQCEQEMLNSQKASAYDDPWKYKILKLKKGDRVFLYSNGRGIIATGLVKDSKVNKANRGNVVDDEFYVHLDSFKMANAPLSSSKIKTLLNQKQLNNGKNLNYRTTLVSLEKSVAEELLRNF